MANCTKLFLEFEKDISLTSKQKEKLLKSRTALQDVIKTAVKENKSLQLYGFFIQGSQSPTFQTTVLKSKDKTYDVDLGIYLKEKPTDITCTTVMKNILDAVAKHTDGGASHLKMCVRVIYAGDFDIDLPIYYMSDKQGIPYIAIKNGDWRKDDPKGTAEWFRKKKKGTNGQLVRVIKFLKAWADKDLRGFKMPSGFGLTVWAATNFAVVERLDLALLNTLKCIKELNKNGVSCNAPCEPFDDLTADLDKDQKDKFIAALDAFIADAEKAVASKNQLEASKLWQKHLGKRFIDGVDEDVDAKEKTLHEMLAPVKAGTAKLNDAGKIQTEVGVPHQIHRNYGG